MIFIIMKHNNQIKKHKLIVRISEEQLNQLTKHIIEENKSKSNFLREIIERELKKLS